MCETVVADYFCRGSVGKDEDRGREVSDEIARFKGLARGKRAPGTFAFGTLDGEDI